jgi:hypothetical protein
MPTRFGNGTPAKITYTPRPTVIPRARTSRQPSTGNQFQERKFPERIPGGGNDAWLVGLAGHAVQGPARALEVFPSAVNVLTGGASLQGANQEPVAPTPGVGRGVGRGPSPRIIREGPGYRAKSGLFDEITETIGRVGFNPFREEGKDNPVSIEGIIAALGGTMKETQTWTAAIVNSSDVALTRKIVEDHLDLDAPAGRPKSGWALGAGFLGEYLNPVNLFNKDVPDPVETNGMFLQDMANRGFFTDYDEETDTLKPLSHADFIAKIDNAGPLGAYQFGDKMISDNAMADMLFRMGTDPTNIAFGLGLPLKVAGLAGRFAGRVASAGRWSFSPTYRAGVSAVARAGKLTSVEQASNLKVLGERSWGVGYADDMEKLIGRPKVLAPITQGARAFAENRPILDLSLKGFGLGMKYMFPKYAGAGLGRRFVVGSTQAQLGLMATQGLTGAAQDILGEDTIVSPWLGAVHDLSESILNNRPLSGDPLFVMMAAFNYPVGAILKGEKGRPSTVQGAGRAPSPGLMGVGREFLRQKSGENYTAYFARKMGVKETTPRSTVARIGRWQEVGKGVESAFYKMFTKEGEAVEVGMERAHALFDTLNLYYAWKRHQANPAFILYGKSLDHVLGVGGTMAGILRSETDALLAAGKIKPKDAFRLFSEWSRDHRSSYVGLDGEIMNLHFPGGVKVPFQSMIDEWADFHAMMSDVSSRIGPMHRAVIGRAQNMMYAGTDALLAAFDDTVKDGIISTDWMADIVYKNMAMFTDPAIPTATRTFFAEMLNAGIQSGRGKYGAPKGSPVRHYDAAQVREHIVALRDAVVNDKELFHESIAIEDATIDDLSPIGGPLQLGGGITRMWNPKEIAASELRSHSDARALMREIALDQSRYDARWQKRKEARPTTRARQVDAEQVMERTLGPDEGSTWDPIAGEFYDPAMGGFAVRVHPADFELVARGDIAALRNAMDRAAREHPDAMIGTWLDPDNGMVGVDPSRIFQNRAEAIAFAKSLGQRAVYDMKAGVSIKVPRAKGWKPPQPRAERIKELRTRLNELEAGQAEPSTSTLSPEILAEHQAVQRELESLLAEEKGIVWAQPTPAWEHPGPSPREKAPADIEMWPNDEAVAWYQAQRNADRAWQYKMAQGVSMGKISEAKARAEGWKTDSSRPIDPLPPGPLYHATFRKSQIMAEGLKTRAEADTTGLGGGPDDTVSFTTEKVIADRIAEVLTEANAVLTGKITVKDLMARAEAGGFRKGMESTSLALKNKTSYHRIFDLGLKYKFNSASPLRKRELPPGARFPANGAKGSDGLMRYHSWWEPMTPKEVMEANFDAYRAFTLSQDLAGGPMDPMFFMADLEALRSLDPAEVGVIEAEGIPGAHGYKPGGLQEWRTYTGQAVSIKGREVAPPPPGPDVYSGVREAQRRAIEEKKGRLAAINEHVNELQRRMEEIGYVELHETWRGHDGRPVVRGEDLDRIQAQTKYTQETYPEHTIKQTPANHLPWGAADSVVGALLTQRTNFGRVLYDYGPLAKFTQFLDYVTEPVSASQRAKDGRQMIYSMLQENGATVDEVTSLLANMAKRRHEGGTIGPMKIEVLRNETSLSPSQIEQAFDDVFGQKRAADGSIMSEGNPAVREAIEKRWGNNPSRLIDQASNSLVRRGEQAIFEAGRVDPKDYRSWSGKGLLERITASGYGAFQNIPGIASGSRLLAHYYPIARFYLSIRWQIQNRLENRILAWFQDGMRASGLGRRRNDILMKNSYTSAQARVHGHTVDPNLKARAAADEVRDYQETGIHTGHFLEPVMRDQYSIRSTEDLANTINDLPKNHPDAIWMSEHFGPIENWAGELENMLYNWDRDGVVPTLNNEAAKVFALDKYTPAEIAEITPFLNRIAERHAESFADIVATQMGNISRSRIERMMNSYWLFWPISYQIKTAKIMVDMLSGRMFGRQTNLGGAVLLDRLHDQFEEMMKTVPRFRQEMESNETLWMAYNMLLPAVPWDHSVSLSRLPRYVGGNVLHLWDEYANLEGPAQYAQKMLEMGLYYDTILWGRVGKELEESPDEPPAGK